MGKLTAEEKQIREVERDHLRMAKKALAKAERHMASAELALIVAKRAITPESAEHGQGVES